MREPSYFTPAPSASLDNWPSQRPGEIRERLFSVRLKVLVVSLASWALVAYICAALWIGAWVAGSAIMRGLKTAYGHFEMSQPMPSGVIHANR